MVQPARQAARPTVADSESELELDGAAARCAILRIRDAHAPIGSVVLSLL